MKIMAVYLLQLLKGNDWLIGIVPIAIDKTTRVFYVIENSRLYAAALVNAQQDEIAVYYIYIWMKLYLQKKICDRILYSKKKLQWNYPSIKIHISHCYIWKAKFLKYKRLPNFV